MRAFACLLATVTLAAADPAPAVAPIEIALLLDTSNSMDGLIHQARAQLWEVVRTAADASREGRHAPLRVALIEYGNTRLSAEHGWIRTANVLTTDLDAVSAELFALKTQGGDEWCAGAVLHAVQELPWTPGDGYRAIIIAGNEPFTQGKVAPETAVRAARERGIVLTTVHCPQSGEAGADWAEAGRAGGGEGLAIAMDHRRVESAMPQDARIAELNRALNDTYLPYGARGAAAQELQMAQDANSAGIGSGSFAGRAAAKASSAYCNDHWDLVDAVDTRRVDLATLRAEELPPALRDLDAAAREAAVARARATRAALRAELAALVLERERALAADGVRTWGTEVAAAIGRQLTARGYVLARPAAATSGSR